MKNEKCKMQVANLTSGVRCSAKVRNNLQSSIFNFQLSVSSRSPFALRPLLLALGFLPFALCPTVSAQTVADKMVATVTNGSRATPDLITYSDLVWQLALEPNRPFVERPGSKELNEALRLLEDQLLILQEARKLPSADTPEAIAERDNEVQNKRDELAKAFGSRTRLEERMSRVGLTSEQLDAILRDRVSEEKYLDFRFRAFVLISPKEITDRYNQEYTPLRNSGRIVPTLEQVRSRIEQQLTEERIASEIDTFVDNLREQPGTEIVILNPV